MQEEWSNTEFWGYQISNLGNVRSVDRFQTNSDGKTYHYKAKHLKPVVGKGRNGDGYMIVNLRKPRGVPVAQYDVNNELINTFVSVAEAARQTGIGIGNISHCINNRAFTAGGYKWKKLSSQSTIENIK